MARFGSRINNFCIVFGAGIFLCIIGIILSRVTETVFHGSESLLGWLIAFSVGGTMLVKLSQSKRNTALTFLWAAIGYVGLFGSLAVIGVTLITWTWRYFVS